MNLSKYHLTLLTIILYWSSINCTKATSQQQQQKKEAPSNQANQVNADGSFHFEYENKDRGGHYHKATGSVIKVRGRYGSRSPADGRIDEVIYTAGSRGYRARGANIHRKQNLSQNRRNEPIGSATDPLADPSDDPSYAFAFKTKNHARREESDSSGRVQGQYLYVDDAGDKHGVSYKAGANEGYHVDNGVPDQPGTLNYNSPLYKTDQTARGKISFERGPDREYKFITTSPDQRRAETTGPDGITRGSYSYLDDQGVQRTVQYIAGAGIGYKVLSSTVGPGTHISANSDVPEYSIKAVSNEIAVSNEPSAPYPHTGPSAPSGPGYYPSTTPTPPSSTPVSYTPTTATPYPPSAFSGVTPPYYSTPRPFSRPTPEYIQVSTPSTIGGINRNYEPSAFSNSGPSPPSSPSAHSSEEGNDIIYGLLPPKEDIYYTKQYVPPTPPIPSEVHITPHAYYPTHAPPPPQPTLSIPPSIVYQTPTYLPTPSPSPYSYIPTVPTIASNYQPIPPQSAVGDAPVRNNAQWFYGIAAGAAKRAHIQNIDLVPYNERALSPSEALRRDEEREKYQRHQQLQQHQHHYQHPLLKK